MTDKTEVFMRDTDTFSWRLEEDPGLRSTIVAVAWLDASPDFGQLADRLDLATRQAPRFRQRPVEALGRLTNPRWVDTDFDLSLHLHRIDSPAPHTDATVIEVARIEAMTGFDRSRPLWQFTLIEHLRDDRAALVMKVHHSLTDGIGGMQLAFLLFEVTDQTERRPREEAPAAAVAVPGGAELARESVAYELHRALEFARHGFMGALPAAVRIGRNPVRALSDALVTVRSIGRFVQPVPETLSPLMTGRSLDRHLDMISLDLGDLKRAAKSAGGTVNDAFVTSVTGGLRRYHELHGAPVEDLRMTLPISVRKETDPPGGNRITLERFRVPVGLADPRQRMRTIGRRCKAARDDRALPLSDTIAGALNLLPASVVGSMLKHVDFLASNVPGVAVPIYLIGVPVSAYSVFGPTTGSAVNVTLLSHQGTCCVGVTIDAASVPDCDAFMTCLRQGFEEVLELGGGYRPVRVGFHDPPPPGPNGMGEELQSVGCRTGS